MALARSQRVWLQRTVSLLLVLVLTPLVLALASLRGETPIRSGELSPRTVVAGEPIRVVDEEATERARRAAADNVEPVVVFDEEAQAEVIQRIRDVFDAVEDVRQPADTTSDGDPEPPTREEQVSALQTQLPFLDEEAIRELASLSTRQIGEVERETVDVARELARQRIREDQLQQVLDQQLRVELALRNFPGNVETLVVDPLIRAVMQPTVRIDQGATEERREEAAAQVADVQQTWPAGTPIVRAGETVSDLQYEAISQLGLEGSDPLRVLLLAIGAMGLVVIALAAYLAIAQPKVWHSGRSVLLLAILILGYAVIVGALDFLVAVTSHAWWYAAPAGGLAMLATILLRPAAGVAMVLPGAVIPVLLAARGSGVGMFLVAATFLSVPLAMRLGSRGDLRSALLRAGVAYPLLAALAAAVFDGQSAVGLAATAGLVNGILGGILVQGLLPFLESLFRIPTVTTLLDLADRNHPLLRELEHKALGSYNHSVMTATLVERACRAIGANALLGSVAALYHDIGKVRRPHFFIENQQGIPNPHDELEPQVSAVIIQEHVKDGVEMAREFKLPPEVVRAIGSHHGTTLVKFFYRRALEDAEEHGDPHTVEESHYRYKGEKPRRKEAAVLFIADSCEATTRSVAMDQGTLSRDEIEYIVDDLIADRVDDGQLEDADLTFAELSAVRNSIVESLVGVYHPRIAYPKSDRPDSGDRARKAATPA